MIPTLGQCLRTRIASLVSIIRLFGLGLGLLFPALLTAQNSEGS